MQIKFEATSGRASTPSVSINQHRPTAVGSIAAALLLLGATATAVHGDERLSAELFDPATPDRPTVDVHVGGSHSFRGSLDDGGSVAVTRAAIDTSLRLKLAEPLTLALSAGFQYDNYDFGGIPFPVVGSTIDPWDDIHTLRFGGLLTYAINQQWSVSGGLFGQFSQERGASWQDGFSGGGLVSVSYRFGERGVIGGGVGVTSAIEDDARLFPVFVIDVPLTDTIRISSLRVPTPLARNGIEIICNAAPTLEFALGTRYDRSRFRLNDSGSVPGGIGEDLEIPVWLRCTWTPAPNMRVDLMAGVIAWREFRISEGNGLRIDTDRGNATATLGAAFSMTF